MKRKVLMSCLAICLWSIPGFAANITAQTNEDESRLQALRGLAEVLMEEAQGTVAVPEGEELIVKPGGRRSAEPEADPGAPRGVLSRLADNIVLDEIPEVLRDLRGSQQESFAAFSSLFQSLSTAEAVSQDDAAAFTKSAERFLKVLDQDQFLLAAAVNKVQRAMAEGSGGGRSISVLAGYTRIIADCQRRTQGCRTEVGAMLRFEFRIQDPVQAMAQEIETQLTAVWGEVEGIIREMSANPAGLIPDWLLDARERLSAALPKLAELSARVTELRSQYPADATLQALEKSIADRQSQINALLKVPESGQNAK